MQIEKLKQPTAKEIRSLIYAFAIGDALGGPFEFESPSESEIIDRFNGNNELTFTDDTYLLLTTVSALLAYEQLPSEGQNWESLYDLTCKSLHQWFLTGDYRGIGDTTYQALKQLDSYSYSSNSFSDFTLHERGYNRKWSAGNGALSRYLPMLLFINDINEFPLERWVQITHLHEDATLSTRHLDDYIRNSIIPSHISREEPKGFYCMETLQFAIDAVEQSSTLSSAFLSSIVDEGDNDSIAALTFALWSLKNGYDDFTTLEQRVSAKDKQILDNHLRSSFIN